MSEALSRFFLWAHENRNLFRILFFVVLVVLVALNVFEKPEHPHVHEEVYPGFWAVFGLGAGVVMIYLIKRIIANLVAFDEDTYDRL
jgi:ABC-type Mn2+/Zn2+ transport system permease subunit